MYLCYLDESGSPDDPNNQHFVLVGMALPAHAWKQFDGAIASIKRPYGLEEAEIHTGWMMRPYSHEGKISSFSTLGWDERRLAVSKLRQARESALAAAGDALRLKRAVIERKKTAAYVHLTHEERVAVVRKISERVSSWQDVRLFGGAIDRAWFNKTPRHLGMFEFAFDNIVNRFQLFLTNRAKFFKDRGGLSKRKTALESSLKTTMRRLHRRSRY